MTSAVRICLRDPVPELFDAARLLDDAVTAHLAADRALADALIRRADMPIIRDWSESLWGKKSPYKNYRRVEGAPRSIPRAQRILMRMPTTAEKKALLAGAFLKIPEMWVLDLNRNRLTFYHLITRGQRKGTYKPQPRSRAFPDLLSAEVLERLNDPETGDTAFLRNCRAWVEHVLIPRRRAENGGA